MFCTGIDVYIMNGRYRQWAIIFVFYDVCNSHGRNIDGNRIYIFRISTYQFLRCNFTYFSVEFLHYFTTLVTVTYKISGSTSRARLTGESYHMRKQCLIFSHSFKREV